MADAGLVPPMLMPNVTSIVLAVISDQRAKKTRDAISIRGRSDHLSASKRGEAVEICRDLIVRVLGMRSRRQ
jgi:hypothetical protein